jgi:hypothetical protein
MSRNSFDTSGKVWVKVDVWERGLSMDAVATNVKMNIFTSRGMRGNGWNDGSE